MSGGSKKDEPKKEEPKKEKDFTGILELSAMMPPPTAEEIANQDPFVVNEVQAVEQIDHFESIDQIGMMDHVAPPPDPVPPEAPQSLESALDLSPALDDSFAVSTHEPDPNAMDFSIDLGNPAQNDFNISISDAPAAAIDNSPISASDFAISEPVTPPPPQANFSPQDEKSTPASDGFSFQNPNAGVANTPHTDPFADHPPKSSSPVSKQATGLDGIKQYSERARETSFQSDLKNPFHLWLAGSFDPFSRDKLLLFITDTPVGLNSMELDRQINAGKVLLPRISEFAGVKLIQDLRDSGLSFKLRPSSRDEDEVLPKANNLNLHYESNASIDSGTPVIVLPKGPIDPKLWQSFDSIQMVQFLKAEIVEVERSEIFQELLERMTVSLKNKARLKGAAAIASLEHQLKPLRLPSHYQLELKASLLKKL